jgi:hypothetical protein
MFDQIYVKGYKKISDHSIYINLTKDLGSYQNLRPRPARSVHKFGQISNSLIEKSIKVDTYGVVVQIICSSSIGSSQLEVWNTMKQTDKAGRRPTNPVGVMVTKLQEQNGQALSQATRDHDPETPVSCHVPSEHAPACPLLRIRAHVRVRGGASSPRPSRSPSNT